MLALPRGTRKNGALPSLLRDVSFYQKILRSSISGPFARNGHHSHWLHSLPHPDRRVPAIIFRLWDYHHFYPGGIGCKNIGRKKTEKRGCQNLLKVQSLRGGLQNEPSEFGLPFWSRKLCKNNAMTSRVTFRAPSVAGFFFGQMNSAPKTRQWDRANDIASDDVGWLLRPRGKSVLVNYHQKHFQNTTTPQNPAVSSADSQNATESRKLQNAPNSSIENQCFFKGFG